MQPLDRIDFVYGANDLVSYCDSEGKLGTILRPEEYGSHSAEKLVVLPRTIVATHVVGGVGHTMARPGAHAPDDDTLDFIVNLAKRSGRRAVYSNLTRDR